MTDDLVTWLRAQFDDDEQVARSLGEERWRADTYVGDYYNVGIVVDPHGGEVARCGVEVLDGGEDKAQHIARWDPVRILDEVNAKRQLLDYLVALEDSWNLDTYKPIQLLARPYADRDGYRDEWRPDSG